MSLLQTVCPSCRSSIPVDDTREKVFCMYCGTSLFVEELSKVNGFYAFQRAGGESEKNEVDPKAITVRGSETSRAPVDLYFGKTRVATVRAEEIVVLDVKPGRYDVWARVGIEGSTHTEMDVEEGDRLQIEYRGFRGYIVNKI